MTLAIRQETALVPFQEQYNQAVALVKSGLLPRDVNTPEKALAIVQKGREVGLQPMESFELINVIQGKPTVSPKGQLVQIYRSGLLDRINIADDGNTCTVTMVRKGGSTFTTSWSMADAQAAGLMSNDTWKKYPKQMRQWRAVGYCADVLFPDVTGGMYQPEEFGAEVGPDGEPVNREALPQGEAQAVQPEPQPEVSAVVLDDAKQRLASLYRRAVPKVWADRPSFEGFLGVRYDATGLSQLQPEAVDDLESIIIYAEAEGHLPDFDEESDVVEAEATVEEDAPAEQPGPALVGEAPLLPEGEIPKTARPRRRGL